MWLTLRHGHRGRLLSLTLLLKIKPGLCMCLRRLSLASKVCCNGAYDSSYNISLFPIDSKHVRYSLLAQRRSKHRFDYVAVTFVCRPWPGFDTTTAQICAALGVQALFYTCLTSLTIPLSRSDISPIDRLQEKDTSKLHFASRCYASRAISPPYHGPKFLGDAPRLGEFHSYPCAHLLWH